MLNFDDQWRYQSPGEMPADVTNDLFALVMRIATQDASAQGIYEIFKRRFAQAATLHAADRRITSSTAPKWDETR